MKRIIFILILSFSCNYLLADNTQINKSKQLQTEAINEKIPYKEILLSLLSSLSIFLIWRVQHQKDKIKDIENQLSEQKYKLYSELVYLVIDLTMASKLGGKPLTEKDILKKILSIKKDLFLYAPDNVFKTFTDWTLQLNETSPGVDHFKTYFKMMKLARKDMGHRSSKIDLDDFMLFLMQDKEEYKKFKEINNW